MPAETPVTIPPATVATLPLPVFHEPPVAPSTKVIVEPGHTVAVLPDIVPELGNGLTFTVVEITQPTDYV